MFTARARVRAGGFVRSLIVGQALKAWHWSKMADIIVVLASLWLPELA